MRTAEGTRRYRGVERQLISAPVFAAMRAAGPLPVLISDTAGPRLAERRTLLAQRVAEVEQKAGANTPEDVLLAGGRLRISPLRAIRADEAEGALAPLYADLPARCARPCLSVEGNTEVILWAIGDAI